MLRHHTLNVVCKPRKMEWNKKNNKVALSFLFILFYSGCKNYQNEMFDWSRNIPKGASIDIVKISQPGFLIIDWDNPDTIENGKTRYYVTEIEGNNNLLKMQCFLEFENNEFIALFGKK